MARMIRSGLMPLAAVGFLTLAACSGGNSPKQATTTPTSAKPSGPPITIGLINTENAPVGSFPELGRGAQAAVRYVNEHLGGLNGRPLQLTPCITAATPESSQACANRLAGQSPVAVIGGIDLSAASSIPVLAKAGIPYVTGSPTVLEELDATGAYALTAGQGGDLLGEAEYVINTFHPSKIAVVYPDLPGLLNDATQAASNVLHAKGITPKLVAAQPDAADLTPALTAATAGNPDILFGVFPAQGCARLMQARQSLGIKVKTFYLGACAEESVIQAAGAAADEAYFASAYLPPNTVGDADVTAYQSAMQAYDQQDAKASELAQAGFADVMNIRSLLLAAGAEPTAAGLTAQLKASTNHPNFMGHPFTCSTTQAPPFNSVCNANVRVLQYHGGTFTDLASTWVNGADVLKLAG